jgi:aspartate aminotransferase
MLLAKRAFAVKPSATLAIESKAKELKSRGLDIISFAAGEPDFDTPLNIKEAAKKAIDAGFTKYCPVSGTPDLKNAIINKFQKDNGAAYVPEQIIVSCGAKHSLFNLFEALLEKGDELLIPAPYWVSYPDMAALAGARAKVIKTKQSDGFKLRPEQLRKAITKRTKAIVINSPSNPCGTAYTRAELKELCDICVENKIFIISDEIYEKLIYDGFEFASVSGLSPEIKENSVIVNGVSKAYSMTGWRIGYAAGPKEIISAMTTIQSQSTSNPASISLKAATEALNGPQDSVETMRKEFEKRRDLIVGLLNKVPGVKCLVPQGAFYVFPSVKKLLNKTYNGKRITTDTELAAHLLEQALIAVVPGEPFGAPGYLRMSYATSAENIEKGLERFAKAVTASTL